VNLDVWHLVELVALGLIALERWADRLGRWFPFLRRERTPQGPLTGQVPSWVAPTWQDFQVSGQIEELKRQIDGLHQKASAFGTQWQSDVSRFEFRLMNMESRIATVERAVEDIARRTR